MSHSNQRARFFFPESDLFVFSQNWNKFIAKFALVWEKRQPECGRRTVERVCGEEPDWISTNVERRPAGGRLTQTQELLLIKRERLSRWNKWERIASIAANRLWNNKTRTHKNARESQIMRGAETKIIMSLAGVYQNISKNKNFCWCLTFLNHLWLFLSACISKYWSSCKSCSRHF